MHSKDNIFINRIVVIQGVIDFMIKIGIDLTYVKKDKVSGIRKYGEELVEGLLKINSEYEIVLFINNNLENTYKNKFSEQKIISIKESFDNIKYVGRIFRKIYKYDIKRNIKKEKCNIVIHPYYDENTPVVDKNRSIGGILDVIPLDIIKDRESKEYQNTEKKYKKIVNSIENIVTLSEYSKKRLLTLSENSAKIIKVIPSSVAKLPRTEKNTKEIITADQQYIFSINSFYKHKNQITLVKAFNKIKNIVQHNLVLVGRPETDSNMSGYPEIIEYINKEKLNDRVKILSYISDEDRNSLFYNADLFVSPSMQEGFGRTPVEAAMCEVPVITTKETSLPEATMNMVYYYENATDSEELANKILEVLNNPPSKEKLRKIAQKFEQTYDERVIAQEYDKLIKEILKEEKK